MLKWFKENIIEPIKEGVEEAKAELAVEKAEKEKLEEEFEATFETISQEEKLALALAAPFRCVATGQYVSLFDIDEEDAQRKPPCLYQIGNLAEQDKKILDELASLLKRDFKATDQQTTLEAIQTFKNALFTETIPDTIAFHAAVISYLTTGAADLGYLTKEEALEEVKEVADLVRDHYPNWEAYGKDFLAGDYMNNALGKKILSRVVKNLLACSGSPWNQVKL
jgi:hypothetical protein